MAPLAGGKHAGGPGSGSRLTAHLHTAVPRSGVTSSRLHTAAAARRCWRRLSLFVIRQ